VPDCLEILSVPLYFSLAIVLSLSLSVHWQVLSLTLFPTQIALVLDNIGRDEAHNLIAAVVSARARGAEGASLIITLKSGGVPWARGASGGKQCTALRVPGLDEEERISFLEEIFRGDSEGKEDVFARVAQAQDGSYPLFLLFASRLILIEDWPGPEWDASSLKALPATIAEVSSYKRKPSFDPQPSTLNPKP